MKKSIIFLVLLIAFSILAVFMPAVPGQIVTEGINSGDVAWMLAATALVLLMTPGLAYFYGGMIDTKNIISTMLQSFIAMGVISSTVISMSSPGITISTPAGSVIEPVTSVVLK